ncbi:hypothetical protein FB451DRAFT_1187947 [Mycena latifolia]|nr:hypothetical protein FB451DRAFT_1187947 [Mycena latifolia]
MTMRMDIRMKFTMGPKSWKEEELELSYSRLNSKSNGHPSLQRTFSAVISQRAGVVPALEPILSLDWIEWNRANGNGNERTSARGSLCELEKLGMQTEMEASPTGAVRTKGLGRSEDHGAGKQLNLNQRSVLVKRLASGDGPVDYEIIPEEGSMLEAVGGCKNSQGKCEARMGGKIGVPNSRLDPGSNRHPCGVHYMLPYKRVEPRGTQHRSALEVKMEAQKESRVRWNYTRAEKGRRINLAKRAADTNPASPLESADD